MTVHPLQFALVTADPDVREFQVVQERRRACACAWRSGTAPLDAPARLRERLSTQTRTTSVWQAAPLTVETVDALERSPGGKLQMIVPRRESIRG